MKLQKFGAKSATADSCFGLIGPRQCSAALGGPATSTEDLRHQGTLNKPGVLRAYCIELSGAFVDRQLKIGKTKVMYVQIGASPSNLAGLSDKD